jgi:hypothetical protein
MGAKEAAAGGNAVRAKGNSTKLTADVSVSHTSCHSPLSDGTSYTRCVNSTATPCCSRNISTRPTHALPMPAHSQCCCPVLLLLLLSGGLRAGRTMPRVTALQDNTAQHNTPTREHVVCSQPQQVHTVCTNRTDLVHEATANRASTP